jgi:hypothetical protein
MKPIAKISTQTCHKNLYLHTLLMFLITTCAVWSLPHWKLSETLLACKYWTKAEVSDREVKSLVDEYDTLPI